MRLTHLGHACLLVEVADTRILIDPGAFSSGFESLTGLDAILITHQHHDHIDMERLPALLNANPEARLFVEPDATTAHEFSTGAAFPAGADATVGPVTIRGVGGQHALIHDQLAIVGNVGYVLSAEGEPTLFHPGDTYSEAPAGVDVLAVPLSAPWTKLAETLAFVDRVRPATAVPIHDAILAANGRKVYMSHLTGYSPEGTDIRDLSDGAPSTFS